MNPIAYLVMAIFNTIYIGLSLFGLLLVASTGSVFDSFLAGVLAGVGYKYLKRGVIAMLARFNMPAPISQGAMQREIDELLELSSQPDFKVTQEIEDRMLRVGLKPGYDVSETGEQIGVQFDEPIYEWIVTRESLAGPEARYNYFGAAQRNKDGVPIEVDRENMVCYKGQLYELAKVDEKA